ncbi:MAG TPA: M23 family peptidase, partial [Cystobacter sp.]
MRLAPVVLCLGVLFAAPLVEAAKTTYSVRNRRIEPNQPLAVALQEAGLPPEQVSAVIAALEGVFDFRKSRVGDQFRLVLREGELDFFGYRQSAVDEWQVRRDGERFV